MAELVLPELGENITQGTVTKVLVKAGDPIKKGQNILELETDKAVLEVPSTVEGIVSEVLVKNGSVVKVGQPVFRLNSTSKPPAESAPQGAKPAAAAKPAPEPAPAMGGTIDMVLPALGENIEKGTVTKILVKAGETLKKGQGMLEIETDKAVLEVPSAMEGMIKEILIKSGAVIKIGQPIFKIAGVGPNSQTASSRVAPATDVAAAVPAASKPVLKPVSENELSKRNTNIPAAPSVRLLARELGIDLSQVPGTGRGGRISNEDVKAYCKMLNTTRPAGGPTAAPAPLPDFGKWGGVRREAMSNVRRTTAGHLSRSWSTIPHVTQFDKVDITELEKLRKTISGTNKKISVTPFIIKVIAAALKKFPQYNASVDMGTQEIIYKDYVNVGVAVDTDRGLLVPVLKNVDKMSILQISDELAALAERAKLRKTTMEELQGGCFTISNLGGIGGTFFTPIINWPEVAILGVSRAAQEPVYINGQFVPRLLLPLSLSYDHRLIDGADGARFLRWVCEAIEQPFLLDLNK